MVAGALPGLRHGAVLSPGRPAPPGTAAGRSLRAWYRALFAAWGAQGWWPGRSSFEVIVGAILAQGVAWSNVEKALAALRRERLLDPRRMRRAGRARLAACLRPAGYYNQKAAKLRAFLRMLDETAGSDLARFLAQPPGRLRRALLGVSGIGPETADSIVLYAANRPSFVVDAYTRRVLARHGLIRGEEPYDEIKRLFESSLRRDPALYNEYHALLVRLGKERCHSRRPRCAGCPLERHLPPGGPAPARTVGRTSRSGDPDRRRLSGLTSTPLVK